MLPAKFYLPGNQVFDITVKPIHPPGMDRAKTGHLWGKNGA